MAFRFRPGVALLAALAGLLLSSRAVAQTVPTPPTPPPPYSPALEADLRARFEREARAAREAELAAARANQSRREHVWRESGREREPEAVPVRYPIVDTRVAGHYGAIGAEKLRLQYFGGALFTRVFPFAPSLGFELGGGIDAVGLDAPRFRWVYVEPAVVTCLEGQSARLCGRGAANVALPFDGGALAPDAFVTLKVGGEAQLFTATMFDGGYASLGMQLNLVGGGSIGGEGPMRNLGWLGFEGALSVSVAF